MANHRPSGYDPRDAYDFTLARPVPDEPPMQSNWGSTADYALLSEAIKSEYSTNGTDLVYAVCNKTTRHVEWRSKTLHEGLQALSGLQEALDAERGTGNVKN
jgi:hypothetical protein